ncbi:replication initiator protein [Blackfly microvirus SF02]|uniref:Replication initiator protein n=1 Tax=Blackfly microvirus SF02 TaxID=2576452 RepID=A0A4P8PK02_9VIRU|nr:replication initiator protein [Blackfly microvirus SF02]
MGCDGPLTAYQPASTSVDRRLVFDKRKSHSGIAVQVPCGQCSGCRLEHSRQWAIRCMHELRSHPHGTPSAMLNLTYDNEHVPHGYTLSLRDYQLFMKKLRKISGPNLRFFGCGEYGDKNHRPHYHIITFNYRPTDTELYKRGPDYNLYTSEKLTSLWGNGHAVIGDVSFESCAYVARYCLKKRTGKTADEHYTVTLPDGSKFKRLKEFNTMSRNPGLAFNYYQKYQSEILAHDNIVMNGHTVSVPRYYDKLTEKLDANMRQKIQKSTLEKIKSNRRRKALVSIDKADNTSRRRRTKELVRLAKLKQKAREL